MQWNANLVSEKQSLRWFLPGCVKLLPLSLPTCRSHIPGSHSKCLLSCRCQKNESVSGVPPSRSNIHPQDTGVLPRAEGETGSHKQEVGATPLFTVESALSLGKTQSIFTPTAKKTSLDLLKHSSTSGMTGIQTSEFESLLLMTSKSKDKFIHQFIHHHTWTQYNS